MQPLALAAALIALTAIVAFVVAPLLRATTARDESSTAAGLAVVERRDRALAALRELEFDHRTGKITDDDYAALVGPLRAEAAAALQAAAAR